MTARLFSLVAIPLSVVGHLLFWAGSAQLLRATQQLVPGVDAAAVALTLGGVLVTAAAIATVAIGSLGAYIVGGLHLVFSLLLHLVPFDPLHGGFSPAFSLMNAMRGAGVEINDGMFFYVPPGAAAVTGIVFVAAALAADRRPSGQPVISTRIVSGLAGVLGVFGLVLAMAGGARVYFTLLVTIVGPTPLDLLMLYAGVLLVGVAVAASRWSAVGALVFGAVVTVVGLIGLAAPRMLPLAGGGWREFGSGLGIFAPSGQLLLIGVLAIVAGLAVRVRARRAAKITH